MRSKKKKVKIDTEVKTLTKLLYKNLSVIKKRHKWRAATNYSLEGTTVVMQTYYVNHRTRMLTLLQFYIPLILITNGKFK